MYKLLADNTENGLEGPAVWAAATHQWNKQPTYTPYIQVGFANFNLGAEQITAGVSVDVDYYTELTERAP